MSEKELSAYYWLKKEIKDFENRIKEFGDGLGSIKYSNEIKAPNHSNNSIQEKIAELHSLYIEKRVSALEEYIKIEKYISTVEDTEIRIIMRKRFLDLKEWEEIGLEIHQDRTTVSKKLRRYLKRTNNSHNSH